MKAIPIALLSVLLCLLAQAQETKPARQIHPPFLQVFVIDPPHPLDWSTPATLLKTTLKNGVSGDYAPNGHLAIYVKARTPNAFGVSEILTGMGRTNKLKTLWQTLYQQYGLTAMVHEFEGDLDSSEATNHELAQAYQANRLSSIRIQLTDEQAASIFEFLGHWIEFGSFRHYGGNKKVSAGEGSGCADFATHFIQLALNGALPSEDWISSVYLPYPLLQEAPGRAPQKVSTTKILKSKLHWGTSERDGLYFSIPDPEKITRWIKKQSPYLKEVVIFPDELPQLESSWKTGVPKFSAPYPREAEQTIWWHWKSISVSQ